MNKRILLAFLTSFICLYVSAQPSYWFQGWERKPDAKQAQAYFMLPGTNVTFTYLTNRVIINAGVGGGGGPFVLKAGDTMTGVLTVLTNVVLVSASCTNILSPCSITINGSGMYDSISPGYFGSFAPPQSVQLNPQGLISGPGVLFNNGVTTASIYYDPGNFFVFDQPVNFANNVASSGIFYGDGSGLSNIVATTTGLTTNLCFVDCAGLTNVLNFTNGLLMAINGSVGPSHGPSLLLEGGGYILLESGDTILLE